MDNFCRVWKSRSVYLYAQVRLKLNQDKDYQLCCKHSSIPVHELDPSAFSQAQDPLSPKEPRKRDQEPPELALALYRSHGLRRVLQVRLQRAQPYPSRPL